METIHKLEEEIKGLQEKVAENAKKLADYQTSINQENKEIHSQIKQKQLVLNLLKESNNDPKFLDTYRGLLSHSLNIKGSSKKN